MQDAPWTTRMARAPRRRLAIHRRGARPWLLAFAMGVGGCADRDRPERMAQVFTARPVVPDEVPRMLNTDLPFRYPAALYARKVQANVTLRLHIDRDGRVHPDSSRVEETSGYGSLDSVAMKGAEELRFVPAKRHGEPMPVTILFPVYFRHPEARALPGDTILTRRGASSTPGNE